MVMQIMQMRPRDIIQRCYSNTKSDASAMIISSIAECTNFIWMWD